MATAARGDASLHYDGAASRDLRIRTAQNLVSLEISVAACRRSDNAGSLSAVERAGSAQAISSSRCDPV